MSIHCPTLPTDSTCMIPLWTTPVYMYMYRICSIRHHGYYLFHRPSLCGVYLRVVFINTSSCQRGNPVDWHHWTRRFWPLCWCRRRLKQKTAKHLSLLFLYLPLRTSREACSRAACFSNSRRGTATIRERRLFRSALPEVRRLFESGD